MRFAGQESAPGVPFFGNSALGTRDAHFAAAQPGLQLSIVVPCYNEEEVLDELERRLTAACAAAGVRRYEIILVNDGSNDGTAALITDIAARNASIVGLDLARNYGHQLALTAGLSFARGERIFVIDADLQDPPELLSEMMKLMDAGANVVYGRRTGRPGESVFKRHTAKWFYRVLDRLTDIQIPLDTGDFRLLDRRTLDVFLSMPEQYRFVRGMIAWVGLRQVEIRYERQARFAGTTKYPFRKMFLFAVDAITGFSIAPLRFSFFLAIMSTFLGLLLAIYVVVYWAIYGNVHGFTAIILTILLFSGIQMFCISVIGEYVGRSYMQLKNRPLFVVRDILSAGEPTAVDVTVQTPASEERRRGA